VVHDGKYSNVKAPDSVLEIDLARGLELLAAKPERQGRAGAAVIKELGEHPDGGPVQVLAGRYGPYVKHGKLNATIPKGTPAQTVTLEEALGWLAARQAAGPVKRRGTGKRTLKAAENGDMPAKKSTAKQPARKKAAPKKRTAKKSSATKKTPAKTTTRSAPKQGAPATSGNEETVS
jgi:DNA topoisomerase-1